MWTDFGGEKGQKITWRKWRKNAKGCKIELKIQIFNPAPPSLFRGIVEKMKILDQLDEFGILGSLFGDFTEV